MINGVVLTLNRPFSECGELQNSLNQDSRITLGLPGQRRLPLVFESTSAGGSHDLHEWFGEFPEVDFVDLVFVGFDDECCLQEPAEEWSSSTIENSQLA